MSWQGRTVDLARTCGFPRVTAKKTVRDLERQKQSTQFIVQDNIFPQRYPYPKRVTVCSNVEHHIRAPLELDEARVSSPVSPE